jgi:hypothetical protein
MYSIFQLQWSPCTHIYIYIYIYISVRFHTCIHVWYQKKNTTDTDETWNMCLEVNHKCAHRFMMYQQPSTWAVLRVRMRKNNECRHRACIHAHVKCVCISFRKPWYVYVCVRACSYAHTWRPGGDCDQAIHACVCYMFACIYHKHKWQNGCICRCMGMYASGEKQDALKGFWGALFFVNSHTYIHTYIHTHSKDRVEQRKPEDVSLIVIAQSLSYIHTHIRTSQRNECS